jgi:hypothetical protein
MFHIQVIKVWWIDEEGDKDEQKKQWTCKLIGDCIWRTKRILPKNEVEKTFLSFFQIPPTT